MIVVRMVKITKEKDILEPVNQVGLKLIIDEMFDCNSHRTHYTFNHKKGLWTFEQDRNDIVWVQPFKKSTFSLGKAKNYVDFKDKIHTFLSKELKLPKKY